jgi:CHAD domain-containing protein
LSLLIFTSPTIKSVPSYLKYFFLRFPGTLGAEESRELEFFDTYDRRWTREGQIWIRQGESLVLITPPSIFPSDSGEQASFGLQKPLKVGRAAVKVRTANFLFSEGPPVECQLVKVRVRTYLVLQGRDDEKLGALTSALVADGWEPFVSDSPVETLMHDRGPAFLGPAAWAKPNLQDPGISFLLNRMKDEWRMAKQYERGIVEDIDTECLHQHRVHLRRVRSLASLGRFWERVPEWNRLKTVLGDLQQQTNELRDLDVLLLDFPLLQAQLPWGEGDNLESWRSLLVRRRAAQWRAVRTRLDSEAHRLSSEEVDRLFNDLENLGEPWPLEDLVVSAFHKAAAGLNKSLKVVVASSPDEALHQVRIRAKKLRYTLDSLGPLAQVQAVKTLTSFLKETQESLGRFQDRSILMQRLKNEREDLRNGRTGPDALAFGLLVGIMVSDHDRQKADALIGCRRLRSKTFQRALDHLVAIPGGSSDES